MNFYELFGTKIASEFVLPLESKLTNEAAVEIRQSLARIEPLSEGHALFSSTGREVARIAKRNDELFFDFLGSVRFKFDTKTLWVDSSDCNAETSTSILLTQVLPMAITLQEGIVLHASTVTDGVRSWSFSGIEGAGKSTLAAAFASKGYSVLTDDASRILVDQSSASVFAGLPEVRLFEKTFQQIYPRKSLAETTVVLAKRSFRTQIPAKSNFPLKGIFCLKPSVGAKVEVKRIRASQAFPTLLENTFRFDLWNKEARIKELECLSAIISSVDLYEVCYGQSWNQLEQLTKTLEQVMR